MVADSSTRSNVGRIALCAVLATAVLVSSCWWQPEQVACQTDANCPSGTVCNPALEHPTLAGVFACTEAPTGDDDDDDDSPAPPPAEIDLIVVMDNSNSMSRLQGEVQAALPQALADLDALGSSIHVGVVTTDIEAFGNGNRGNLRSLGGIGTATSPPCPTDPAVLAEVGGTSWTSTITDLLDVGLAGAGSETGLQAASLALCKAQDDAFWAGLEARPDTDPTRIFCGSIPSDERECNRGLLRDDAVVAVLIVSDEGDNGVQSPSSPPPVDLNACVDDHAADPAFGECSCRIEWWAALLTDLGATVFAAGPSYQVGGDEVLWCDGTFRDIPGPCNSFGSPTCGVAFYQETACLTGGEWWPAEVRESIEASCELNDFSLISEELSLGLRGLGD